MYLCVCEHVSQVWTELNSLVHHVNKLCFEGSVFVWDKINDDIESWPNRGLY